MLHDMKSKISLLISVLIILVIALVAWLKMHQTREWKTYTSDTYGFSINYPGWWKDLEITESKDSEMIDKGYVRFTVPAHRDNWDGFENLISLQILPLGLDEIPDQKFLGQNNRFEYYYSVYKDPENIARSAESAGAVSTFTINKMFDFVTTQVGSEHSERIYKDTKYGFQITMPSTWKKYKINHQVSTSTGYEKNGNDDTIWFQQTEGNDVMYMFGITVFNRLTWEKWGWEKCAIEPKDCQDGVGNYITKNQKYAFVYQWGMQEAAFSDEAFEKTKNVISTFKLIDN